MISIFRGRRWRIYIVILALLSSVTTLLLSLQESAAAPGFNYELAAQNDPPPDEDAFPYGALVIAAQSDTDLDWTQFVKDKYVWWLTRLSRWRLIGFIF